MAQQNGMGSVYSATYSNVPVYELNYNGEHIMRRRSDDWINATHILKAAGLDKPARTRILERDVQKAMHEKVQGGYGKYQGTWVPLADGRDLAERYGVLPRLLPIFDYVAGDQSPPPAPKHTTAASNKPKAPKVPAQSKKAAKAMPAPSMVSDDQYSNMSLRLHDDDTPDNSTIGSTEYLDEDSMLQSADSHKRKRDIQDDSGRNFAVDTEHTLYSDELLDYFLLRQTDEPPSIPPPMPDGWDPNRPVDDAGHTAIHWAAAVADIDTTKELISRGASIYAQNLRGMTPLMKAVSYTNNYEQDTFAEMLSILQDTINMIDQRQCTAFHHAVNVMYVREPSRIGRFYTNCLIEKARQMAGPKGVEILVNMTNIDGDTALHMAARAGSRKFIRLLIDNEAYSDIPNKRGETADTLIGPLWSQSHYGSNAVLTSSPQTGAAQNGGSGPNAADTMAQAIVPLITEKTGKLAQKINLEIKHQNEWYAKTMDILVEARNSQAAADRGLNGFPEPDDPSFMHDLQAGRLAQLSNNSTILLSEVYDQQLAEQEAARNQVSDNMDTTPPTSADLQEKLAIVKDIAEAQKEKRDLVESVVEATGQAGTSTKSAEYQKLLSLTIAEPEDQLAKVMPGVLEALEEVDEAEAVPETPK